jgi:DNA-binding IclR family transcriptional regulator
VQVAVPDGREVVYVERLDSPQTLRLFLEVGRRNSAHSTSTGKVLLAFRPEQELEKLLRGWKLAAKTPRTITDQDRLRSELARVRRQGYAVNEEESELGVSSVAAPIRDASGAVIAAVSAAGPTTRMRPALTEMILAVEEAAAGASYRLGFRR